MSLHRRHLLHRRALLDDREGVRERLRACIFVDLQRCHPLSAIATGFGEKDAVVGDVAEARREAALELLDRVGRCDLAQQRDELRRGERLLGNRMVGAALLQLRDVVLRQDEEIGAVADHHGEKAIELSHVSREDARAR